MTTRPLLGGGPIGAGPVGSYFEGEFTSAPASTDILRPATYSNGQSPSHVLGLVGLAGTALIVQASAALFAPPATQPIPVPASISQSSRNLDQLQPVFSKYPHPEVVVETNILRPLGTIRGQDSGELRQPVINKQFFDNTRPKSIFTVPQTNPEQPAPVIQRYFHPATPLVPIKQWSTQEQEYRQLQAQINKYFHPEVIVPDVVPNKPWAVRGQDITQRQGKFNKYFHPAVVVLDTVPIRQWFVKEQEYTQTPQPKFTGTRDVARLPSREFTSIPNQVAETPQPRINKYYYFGAPPVLESPQRGFISVQPNLTSVDNVNPVIFKYFHTPVDPGPQPVPVLGSISNNPRFLDQPAPVFSKYPHPVVVADTPRIRQFYAAPQASTEIVQPRIVRKFFAPPANIYTINPSGSIVFSGAPSFEQTNVIPVSGGVSFSGTSTFTKTNTIIVSGGLEFTQTVTQNRTRVMQTAGTVVFSGSVTMIFLPVGTTLSRIISRLNVKISKAMGL